MPFNTHRKRSKPTLYTGHALYQDNATITTPIAITGGVPEKFVVDGAGALTNETYLPINISSLWDSANNRIPFTEFENGDYCIVKTEFTLEALSANTSLRIEYRFFNSSDVEVFRFADKLAEFKATGLNEVIDNKIFYSEAVVGGYCEVYILTDNNSEMSNLDISVYYFPSPR